MRAGPGCTAWAPLLTAESSFSGLAAQRSRSSVCELTVGGAQRFATVGCFVTVLQQGIWE